jgi:hypothetical protein
MTLWYEYWPPSHVLHKQLPELLRGCISDRLQYLRCSSPAIEELHLSAQPRLRSKHFDHCTRPHSTAAGPRDQRDRHPVSTAELAHGSAANVPSADWSSCVHNSAANVPSADWSSDRLTHGDSGRICSAIFLSSYRQSQE